VFTLVRRARRRLLHNELFSQAANAGSAALGAFILLLLLGTQVLNWQWLLLIPLAALAVGLYMVRRRLPSAYAAAQLVDRRLGLADTISTALYFRESEGRGHGLPDVIELQARAAERAAESADVRLAIPYSMPRTAYAMAALLLVAGSLFALRYAISRRLDLKPPLASILQQTFSPERKQQARNDMRRVPRPQTPQQADDQASADQEQRAGDPQDSDTDRNSEEAGDQQQGKAESKPADGAAKKQDQEGQQTDGDQQDSDERNGNNADSDSSQQGNGKQDSKQSSSKQDANNASDSNSLMSKVKDAVQNLLSRMKPQQNQSAGQQQSGEQNSQQGKGQQNGGKQQSAKNGQQQNGQQQSDAQEGQNGDQSQNSQDPQGKGTGNSDAKQASKQPGSGIGSQDGDKAIRQAEQLAAMGKISELIGKRAQNISGETTVEVKSTSQVLKTPYAQRGVQHSQSGGEISRDEIPVALQAYVENYFEQVRKQAPPPKK
jgi:hypothetical protein